MTTLAVLTALLGFIVGAAVGYLGCLVALHLWTWEER